MTSLSEVLFAESYTLITPGSHIWLYCDVDSTIPILVVYWYKDGLQLYQNAPHIRIRRFASDTNTTLLLVIDNFQRSDSGTYQCIAVDEGGIFTAARGKDHILAGMLITNCVLIQ